MNGNGKEYKMEQIAEIIEAAKRGDTTAFNELYRYSYDTVRTECLKVLHNSLDAEDIIQETYILIYRRLSSLQNPARFLSWCRTIAHNESVSFIVHQKRKVGLDDFKPPVSDENYAGMDELAGLDYDASPEAKAEQKMLHQLLQDAMDGIPAQRATCLALYQQGNSYKEIASQLSIPVGTVKSNVFYAKEALRKKIRQIERKENVQIHGFVLVPAAGHVNVSLKPPAGGGFIQAQVSDSAMEEEIWKKVSRRIRRGSRSGAMTWQKVLSIVLAVAVIATGIVVAAGRAGKNSTTVPEVKVESRTSSTQSIRVSSSSPSRAEIEKALGNAAKEVIKSESRKTWRNPHLMGAVSVEQYKWKNKSLIVGIKVKINVNAAVDAKSIHHKQYYTYVRFNDISTDSGVIHYKSSSTPHGKLLNIYESIGSYHWVAGYATLEEAMNSGAKSSG